jgi:hypothetical protein
MNHHPVLLTLCCSQNPALAGNALHYPLPPEGIWGETDVLPEVLLM